VIVSPGESSLVFFQASADRVKAVLFEKRNNLIDSLFGELMVFHDFPNWFFPHPQIYDSLYILVG